jgi:hypothetical protein
MVTNFFTDLHSTTLALPSSLIKTLVVNMGVAGGFPKTLARQKELIINIPSYELTYFKRAKLFCNRMWWWGDTQQNCSFSAPMKYIVYLVRTGMFPQIIIQFYRL